MGIYDKMGVGNAFLIFILYLFGSLSFMFFLSTFFSKATLATEVLTLVTVLAILF